MLDSQMTENVRIWPRMNTALNAVLILMPTVPDTAMAI